MTPPSERLFFCGRLVGHLRLVSDHFEFVPADSAHLKHRKIKRLVNTHWAGPKRARHEICEAFESSNQEF